MEDVWKTIKTVYTETASEVLGIQEKKKSSPWISKEILDLSDQRKELKHKKAESEEARKQYNKITKEIKKKVKECKEHWLEKECQEVEEFGKCQNSQKLFKKIKEICGTFNPKLSAIKDQSGTVLEDGKKIKARWKQHFEKLYNEQNDTDPEILKELPATNSHEPLDNVMKEEVEAAIRALKKKKSPGEDNISAEMMQAGQECSTEMMHVLCEKIFVDKQSPEEWSKAIIVPIYKSKDKQECGNYRGISLLSIPSKVYTKILQQRIRKYVEESVSEEQAGFMKGRGTIDQLFVIRQLAENWEKTKPCSTTLLISSRPSTVSGKKDYGRYSGTSEYLKTLYNY